MFVSVSQWQRATELDECQMPQDSHVLSVCLCVTLCVTENCLCFLWFQSTHICCVCLCVGRRRHVSYTLPAGNDCADRCSTEEPPECIEVIFSPNVSRSRASASKCFREVSGSHWDDLFVKRQTSACVCNGLTHRIRSHIIDRAELEHVCSERHQCESDWRIFFFQK